MPLPFNTAFDVSKFYVSQGYRFMTVHCDVDNDPVNDYYQAVKSEDDVTLECRSQGVVPIDGQFALSVFNSLLRKELTHVFPDLGMMYRSVMEKKSVSEQELITKESQPSKQSI